jgi:hypothetical protein
MQLAQFCSVKYEVRSFFDLNNNNFQEQFFIFLNTVSVVENWSFLNYVAETGAAFSRI